MNEELAAEGLALDVRGRLSKLPEPVWTREHIQSLIDQFRHVRSSVDEEGEPQTETEVDEFQLKKTLEAHSDLQSELFEHWLSLDPESCLAHLRLFRHLEGHLQDKVAPHLNKGLFLGDFGLLSLLMAFGKVAHPKLRQWIVAHATLDFLVEHRSHLRLKETDLMENVRRDRGEPDEWTNWAALIPHLDAFPSLSKEEALEQCLRQRNNARPEAIIENKRRLGLSDEQVLNLFFYHKRSEALARKLDLIDPSFHQRIAEQCIAEEKEWAVIQNRSSFKSVDRATLLRLIADKTRIHSSGEPRGLEYLLSSLGQLGDWCGSLDRETVDAMALLNPGAILGHLKLFPWLKPDKTFALSMLRAGHKDPFKSYVDRFSGLDASVGIFFRNNPADREWLASHPALHPTAETPAALRSLWDFPEDPKIPLAIRQSKEVDLFFSKILKQADPTLLAEGLRARLTHCLSPEEYALFQKRRPEALQLTNGKPDFETLAEGLEELIRKEDGSIADCLRKGVEIFGAEAMLKYMNRADLSRHDALHFFYEVIHLQQNGNITPEAFAHQILFQVAKDRSPYPEGTAHHHLAQVADAFDSQSPTEILDKARAYPNIEALQTLIRDLGHEGAFSSWKTLKKTHEISQLLLKTELLEELNEGTMPPKLRAFVEALAFHPNISMSAVMQFWKEPAAFLEIDDDHTHEAINRVKKPSNLLSLPYLGLKAEDLRDALVNGTLDELQTLPTFVREYLIGFPSPAQLYADLRKAIGQQKKGIAGLAAMPRKLFAEAKAWCSQNTVSWEELWNEKKGIEIIQGLSPELQHQLYELVFNKTFGIHESTYKLQTYRVRLGPKSDPSLVVAGNDTASCMPFGSGKNNVYMFNPTHAQLVVERKTEAGTWRTAAQSVMNLGYQTSTPTPELMRAYLQENRALTELVKPGDLERPQVLTFDNIEIAKNQEGERLSALREAYQAFTKDYLAAHAERLGIRRSQAVVGTGYTPAGLDFPTEPNTTIPAAPAGYSDNVHEHCFAIDTGLPEIDPKAEASLLPLTTRDSLGVAMLEGKAFADNPSLLEGLHKMQHNLMGMEIANRHFGRPALSFIYKDSKRTPRGYLLAYEGIQEGEPFVFIDDLASDTESRMAGGRLIKRFFEAYAEHYGNAERTPLPIFTNARDKTSFPILQRNAERMAAEQGWKAKVVELGTHTRGEDLMHDVLVLIGKTDADLREQEEKMKKVFGAGE